MLQCGLLLSHHLGEQIRRLDNLLVIKQPRICHNTIDEIHSILLFLGIFQLLTYCISKIFSQYLR